MIRNTETWDGGLTARPLSLAPEGAETIKGVKALMLAVLEDGIRSYLGPLPRLRGEAEYWVDGPGQRSTFSFTVVCETLGLDPAAVAESLHRARAARTEGRRGIRRSRPNARRGRTVGPAPADPHRSVGGSG